MQEYARATALVPTSCEREVVALLAELRRIAPAYEADSRDDFFAAEQNALVMRAAERYYRTMLRGGAASWNIRDGHTVETLERLMRHHGPGAKAIVWEHNTHIGDACATDMARAGMFNVGEAIRIRHAADGVVLVGYGGYQGSVIAGAEWGMPMQRMAVPPAREGGWEDLLHRAGPENKLLIFGERPDQPHEARGQRAIGVVYHPGSDRASSYVPTRLEERYDAFIALEQTHALHPLHIDPRAGGEPPDTYPWSV
jgi:erythromycin esterase